MFFYQNEKKLIGINKLAVHLFRWLWKPSKQMKKMFKKKKRLSKP